MNIKRNIALLGTAAAVAFGAGAAVAQADTIDVVGGSTELSLNKKTTKTLDELGVTVDGLVLDVKKGEYDFAPIEDGGGGVLKHKGTLTIETEDTAVKLKGVTLDVFGDEGTQPDPKIQGVLTAKVGGKQIEVANLSTKKYESDEKDLTFSGLVAKLSDDGAKALDKALDIDELEGGLKLGSISNESEAQSDGE